MRSYFDGNLRCFVAKPILLQITHFLCGDKSRSKCWPWRNKLASLRATLVQNYDPLQCTDLLTGVRCKATSVAKNDKYHVWFVICRNSENHDRKKVSLKYGIFGEKIPLFVQTSSPYS